ncbi:hypothetical protein NM208_g10260 [Fusarium decemcellulare]|uniref:Uncharacterized protein n=1 Tax=Fusarium decemcellulare TaxID=57161 RepID=A0ACC1RYG7_9HYPO|nr:hypothetical protein NM208_g10260 [Fusarium decemcellulare]
MASLSDCPNEVLLDILRNLVPTTRNKAPASLHSMCLVSKRFFSLAQHFLYSKIHLTWEGEYAENPRIPLLLRSLLERRSLSNYVEHLSLDGDDTIPFFAKGDWVPSISMAAVDMEEVFKFIKSTQMAADDSFLWECSVRQPFLDGVVAVLLALLPNLKSLSMGPDFANEMGVTNCVLQAALSPKRTQNPNQLPRFGQLRSVTFDNKSIEFCKHGYWECSLHPFFYLPEIEHLSQAIHTCCYWKPCPPSPSKLTSLELHRLVPIDLVNLLSVTTGLKKFSWTCCCYPADDPILDDGSLLDDSFDLIDLDQVSEALSKISGTLEELVLKIDDGTHGSPAIEDDSINIDLTGSLRGLSSLVHLKKLQVPWVYLTDWSSPTPGHLSEHFVPESVETLVMTMDLADQMAWMWDEESMFDWMVSFLSGQQGCTNLHIVIFESSGVLDNSWTDGEEEELSLTAAEAGIIFLMDPDAFEVEQAKAERARS